MFHSTLGSRVIKKKKEAAINSTPKGSNYQGFVFSVDARALGVMTECSVFKVPPVEGLRVQGLGFGVQTDLGGTD